MKWRIGAVTVTKIVELEMTGGSGFLLPQATPEAIMPIGWLRPDFADERGRLKMSIHPGSGGSYGLAVDLLADSSMDHVEV
jgi:hypothetical protein